MKKQKNDMEKINFGDLPASWDDLEASEELSSIEQNEPAFRVTSKNKVTNNEKRQDY